MSEPRRILDDDPHGLGASLVRAARDERPPPHSKRKALVGLGLVAGSATAASNAGAALSAAKSAGTLPLVLFGKWMGVGVVVGAVAVGGVEEHIGRLGVQQPAQAGLAGGDGLVDPWIAHVHRLARHRVQHLVGHRRRPG